MNGFLPDSSDRRWDRTGSDLLPKVASMGLLSVSCPVVSVSTNDETVVQVGWRRLNARFEPEVRRDLQAFRMRWGERFGDYVLSAVAEDEILENFGAIASTDFLLSLISSDHCSRPQMISELFKIISEYQDVCLS